MSSDIYEKSWVELLEEDEEGIEQSDADLKIAEDDVEMQREEDEEEPLCKDTGDTANLLQNETAVENIKQKTITPSENECSSSFTDKKICRERDAILISKFIKEEKEIKVSDELLSKYIKQERENTNDDIDDMYLFMKDSVEQETKIADKPVVSVKEEIKTELKMEGAEDEWAAFAGPTEKAPASHRPTFAEICAKNASPAPVVQTNTEKCMVSPTKKQRKRSLFPEDPHDSKKEVFGILDENSVDSPSKDIRKIMKNIHMDSPLRSDSENIDNVSGRKKAIAIRRDLTYETSKAEGSSIVLRKRTRTRDSTRASESPASKMAHYSSSPKVSKVGKDIEEGKDSKDSKDGKDSKDVKESKDSPARKSKGIETDKATLSRRQKQIDYGKNTKGYDNYLKMVPKEKREAIHPKTPPKHLLYSRRAWDGLVKVWRQKLHFWDSPADGGKGGIGLPDSWDSLSEGSVSVSNSDEMSEQSQPSTPTSKTDRKKRKASLAKSVD